MLSVFFETVEFFSRKHQSQTLERISVPAGMAATEALKILLKRGEVLAAPRGLQFDAYRNKLSKTWLPGGNRNPLQRLALMFARKKLDGLKKH